MPEKCPYCDFTANDTNEEIAHMEQAHPEEVQRRLREAGIEVEDYRQGPDLPSYLTLKELQMVLVFALRYGMDEYGFTEDNTPIGIHVRDRGLASKMAAPWIEFSVGLRKFAIWRHTGDLYEVGADGAVKDEPLHRAN